MDIQISILTAKVESIQESQGWVYGTLAQPQRPQIRWVTAVKATRPWISNESIGIGTNRAEEILLEFVNLEHGNTAQALAFLRKYGLFQDGDRAAIKMHPQPVKAFWEKARRSRKTPFATDLHDFWQVHQWITGIWQVISSLPKQDHPALELAIRKINPCLRPSEQRDLKAFAKDVVSYYVSQGLSSVPVGISQVSGKMVPVAISSSLRPALYLALLSYITRGTPIKECENEDCRGVFVVTRPWRRFCSGSCQNLVKIRRHRQREHPVRRTKRLSKPQ